METRPRNNYKKNSIEGGIDNGRINVYKNTLMFYEGEYLREKRVLIDTLKNILPMDWNDLLYEKMFYDKSYD